MLSKTTIQEFQTIYNLQELKQKSQKVKWGRKGRKEYFALVAKGGFSKGLVKEAQKEGIVLIQEDQVETFGE